MQILIISCKFQQATPLDLACSGGTKHLVKLLRNPTVHSCAPGLFFFDFKSKIFELRFQIFSTCQVENFKFSTLSRKKKSAKIFNFPSRKFENFDFKSKILAKIFDLPSRICLVFGFKSKMFGKNFRLSENCHLKSTGKLCKLENFALYNCKILHLKSKKKIDLGIRKKKAWFSVMFTVTLLTIAAE